MAFHLHKQRDFYNKLYAEEKDPEDPLRDLAEQLQKEDYLLNVTEPKKEKPKHEVYQQIEEALA